MHINVFYEDDGRIDIIDVPTEFVPQLAVAQSMFFNGYLIKTLIMSIGLWLMGKKLLCI